MGKSLILTADDNKLLPKGTQQPIATKRQNSLVLTSEDNQYIKKKEDGQPSDNGSPELSQPQLQSQSENTSLPLSAAQANTALQNQQQKALTKQDIDHLPEFQDNPLLQQQDAKKVYAAATNVKTPDDISNDVRGIVNTYYDVINPIDPNKVNGFGYNAQPVYGSDATKSNIVLPPTVASQYNNSISKSPVQADVIQANKDARQKIVTGIQQGNPDDIKKFKDLATQNLQSKIKAIDNNPQGGTTTEGVAMEYQPAKTVYHLSPGQMAEKKALQQQIDHINNSFDEYTQIALVDKTSKKPGGLYSSDNVIDLGNNLRSYNGADISRENLISDATAKTETNYLNEQAGLNAIRNVKGKQYASYLKDYLATGNPDAKERATDIGTQLDDVNNRIQTLPDKYAPVRIGYVARLMGEYISDLHPVMNVFITDADRRQAVNNIEKDYPGFSDKYRKEIDFINANGGIETLIPHQGFIGALNRGGVAGTNDIINFGKDFFGIRSAGDRAADEVKADFDAYMRGTAQSGGGKVVLNKDGLTFEQRDDENYTPTNFNSAMSKIGNFIGGVIPFVASTELGSEGAATIAGRLGKAADAISTASKAKRLANLADFGETDVLGYDAAAQAVKTPALSAAQKQLAGNIVGNYVMNFDNNLNVADKLIKDQSGAGDAKKALVANLLTWGQIAAFSALPLSSVAKKLVSDGLEKDAGKMISDLGEENILNAAGKDGFKSWAANYVVPRILTTINTLKNTGTTTAKGLSEMVLMNHLNAGINSMFDENGYTKNHNVWDEDLQTVKDMGLGMIGLAGIGMISRPVTKGLLGYFTGEGGIPNVLRQAFPMTTRDALYEAAGNVDENVSRIRANIDNGSIEKDAGNHAISIIRTAGEMYPLVVNAENEGLPKTTKQKAQMLAEMVRGRLLEQADKKQGIPELMQGVNDSLDNIQADNRYNQVQPLHNLAGDVVGHESLGEPIEPNETHPVKVGDKVQWVRHGADIFEEPKKVTGISEDGTHVFVEGSTAGIPIHEIENLSSPKTKSNESKSSNEESGSNEAVSQESASTGKENTSQEEGDVSDQNVKGSRVQPLNEGNAGVENETAPAITNTVPSLESKKEDIEKRRKEALNKIDNLKVGDKVGWGTKDRGDYEAKVEYHAGDRVGLEGEKGGEVMLDWLKRYANKKYDAELKALEDEAKKTTELPNTKEEAGIADKGVNQVEPTTSETENQNSKTINSQQNEKSNNNEIGNEKMGGEQSRYENGQENGSETNQENQEKVNQNETQRNASVNAANKKNLGEQPEAGTAQKEPGSGSENDLRLEHGNTKKAETKNVGGENAFQKQATGEMGVRNESTVRKEVGGNDKPTQPANESGEEAIGEEGGQENKVGISHAALTKLADKLGLSEPERGTYWSPKQYAERGRALLSAGADPEEVNNPNNSLHDRIGIARAHLEDLTRIANDAQKKFGVDSQEFKDAQKEVNDYAAMAKKLGTEAHRAFVSLQGERDLDTNSFSEVKRTVEDITGKPTTKEQDKKIKDLTEQNEKLKVQADELEKKLVEATTKSLNEKAVETKPKERAQKKSHEDFVKERSKAIDAARDALKNIRTGKSGLTAVPIPFARELAAIAPHIGTIVKSYVEEGVNKLEDIVDKIHDTFSDDLRGLRRSDVLDLISGKYIEKKDNAIAPSKDANIKKQAQLVRRLEDLQAGLPEEKTNKTETPSEIKALLEKIAKVKKDLAALGYMQPSPEELAIKRLEKQLEDVKAGKVEQYQEPRKKSEREKELLAEIKDIKDKTGITEKEKQAQNVRRLEKELDDAKNNRLKTKPNSRTLSEKEKSLQEQIDTEKSRIALNDLQERFADKKDNKFTPDEAKALWDYTQKTYLDKGVLYRQALVDVSNDTGLSWRQVSDAFTSPKLKPISDEMWKKQGELRRNQLATRLWIDDQAKSPVAKALKKISGIFRGVAVFGHGGIFIGTHAGMTLFQPSTWKHTIPAFFKAWKFAYGNHADYERAIEELKNRPNYILAERAGLKNNPDRINADEYQRSQHFLGRLGMAGEKGFNAIKVLRQDLFDAEYNRLSDEAKADPKSAENIAKLINNATGATNLKLPEWVNEASFAGGMEAARWGKLTRNPMQATSIALKAILHPESVSASDKVFAKVWARRVGEQLATYGSILAANAAIQSFLNPKNPVNLTNPNQSDWLKFKFGNETIDPTSGMLGSVNFVTGLANAATENQKELHGASRTEAFGKKGVGYLRGKLAPLYSTIWDFASQSDFNGNPLPFSNDKPRTGAHKLSWAEYASEKAPLPVAEAFKVMFQSAQDNGMEKPQMMDILKGIASGAFSGGTGFRISENKERPTPFNEQDKSEPAFKYFLDKGLELPNTSPSSELITDEKNGTKKKLSDYPKDVQEQYSATHKEALKQNISNILSQGSVYVKSYKDADGKEVNEVSINEPSDGKYQQVNIDKLSTEELVQLLHIAQSRATKQTKQQLFNPNKEETNY